MPGDEQGARGTYNPVHPSLIFVSFIEVCFCTGNANFQHPLESIRNGRYSECPMLFVCKATL